MDVREVLVVEAKAIVNGVSEASLWEHGNSGVGSRIWWW
jgi:hypothetical protein